MANKVFEGSRIGGEPVFTRAAKEVLYTQIARVMDQRVVFTQLLDARDTTMRITIQVDSYPNQSFGRVEGWNGKEWAELWTIPGELIGIDHKLAYQVKREPGGRTVPAWDNESWFLLLRNKLYVLGCTVLGERS